MSTIPEELLAAARTLKDSGLSQMEIVERLIPLAPGDNRTQKCGVISRAFHLLASPDPLPDTVIAPPDPKPIVTRAAGCVEDAQWLKGRVERVIVSDLHIPRHRQDLLLYIARKHKGADLVINGDVLNYEKAGKWDRENRDRSRFPEWKYSLQQCFDMAVTDLSEIAKYFRRVVILRGNHDDWGAKAAARAMDGDSSVADAYFEQRFEEIPNVFVAKKTVRDYFIRKFGDMWIGHFKTTGKPSNKAANNAIEWLLSNTELAAMGPWQVCVQGHSHRLSQAWHLGKLGIECGALTQIADYQDSQPGKGSPPQLGYYTTIQYDGETDIMETLPRNFPLKYVSEHMQIEGYQGPIYENFG